MAETTRSQPEPRQEQDGAGKRLYEAFCQQFGARATWNNPNWDSLTDEEKEGWSKVVEAVVRR